MQSPTHKESKEKEMHNVQLHIPAGSFGSERSPENKSNNLGSFISIKDSNGFDVFESAE